MTGPKETEFNTHGMGLPEPGDGDDESIHALRRQGVNFINILLAHILYKSALHSFSVIIVLLCDFLSKEFQGKSCS
jgi:hypothetical protein